MKRISVREVILDLSERTDDLSIQNIPLLLKWAKYCEKRINSFRAYAFKATETSISNFSVDIPEDCLRVDKVLFGSHSGDLQTWFSSIYNPYVNTFFTDMGTIDVVEHTWLTLGGVTMDEALWQEDGEKLYFAQQYDGQDITIWYRTLEMEPDGFFKVNESHMEAIRFYLEKTIIEKEKWRLLRAGQNISMISGMLAELEFKYSKAVGYAVAMDDKEVPTDKIEYDRYKVR